MSDDAARDPATDETVYADSAAPSSFREPETDDDLERGLAYAAARRRLLGELDAEPPRLAHYYLLETLGSGAMGVVFAAYDPDLDRKVAIKLLRAGPDDSHGRQRLQREARALARLTHPNVVTVHGIGVQDGQPWVAMEFVAGSDLRQWLGAHERPWEEVLEVFVAAARGLAAAHSADVVHRDFKPANVLIGDDGVPRVADFGLARPAGVEQVAGQPDDSLSSHESLRSASGADWRNEALTRTRGMVGTPVYMAPEQYVISDVGPAADQYAFFVSLYEGVYGTLPFSNQELLALVEAKASGTIAEPPRDSKVPRWLHRIIVRGLAAKPDDRFASMDAVIAEIESARRGAKGGDWRLWVGAVAIAGVAAGVGGRLSSDPSSLSAEESCAGAGAPIDDVWANRRDAIQNAVLDTELPYAEDSWAWIDREMNTVGEAWGAARREVCAAELEGTMTSDIAQRRLHCLEDKLANATAVTNLFARADADILSATDRLLARLGNPEECMGDGPLQSMTLRPADPQARERGDAVMGRIVNLHALRLAGKRDEAKTETNALREYLDDDLEPLVRGELKRVLSLALDPAKPEHGELLRGALADAIRARADRLAVMVYYDLGIHEATAGRPGRAIQYYELGLATADRVDTVAERLGTQWSFVTVLRPALETVLGVALGEQGNVEESLVHLRRGAELANDIRTSAFTFVPMEAYNNYAEGLRVTGSYPQALEYYDRAIQIGRETMGMQHPHVGKVLNNRGAALVDLGRYDDARHDLELGREIKRTRVGENHPDVALLDYNLSLIDINTGNPKQARATLERVRNVWDKRLPEAHPWRRVAVLSMGTAARHAGDVEEALDLITEARTGLREVLGERPHLLVATADAEYALTLVAVGRADEAVKPAGDAVAGFEKSVGLSNAAASVGLFALGEVARARSQHEAAIAAFDRSIAVLTDHVSREHPELASPLVGRAESQLALGKRSEARASLDRAKALTEPGAIPSEVAARIAALEAALSAD